MEYLVRHLHLVALYLVAILLEVVMLGAAVNVNATFRVVWLVVLGGFASMVVAMWSGRMPGVMVGNHVMDGLSTQRTRGRPRVRSDSYASYDPWLGNIVMSIPPLIAGYILLWGGPYMFYLACTRRNPAIEAVIPCGDESYYGWRIPFGVIAMGVFVYFFLMSLTIIPAIIKRTLAIALAVVAIVALFAVHHDPAVDSPVVRPKNGPAVTST